MLHLEYSLRTEKKTPPQHKSTYTINTWLATGGTYPALASSRPVRCHLLRRRSQTCSTGGGTKRYRGSWMGEGSNVCSRGWEQESPTASLSQGSLSRRPWPRRRYGEPEKIRLNCCDFWGEQLQTSTAHSPCPFWSLKSPSFTCKAVNFIMMASIFRFIVSVSLLTALPTVSIKTGSLVRLWTAVPVFRIFR